MNEFERRQKDHFNRIAKQYSKHYGDYWSLFYRNIFINRPLFKDISVESKRVLDALCGSGESSHYLEEKNCQVVGLDISENEVAQYDETFPCNTSHCASIFSTGYSESSFDIVVIVGGLHHLHPNIELAVIEIHRILRPGGYFLFCEPHKGSVWDRVRSFWYKHDSSFETNEESVDIDNLKRRFHEKFVFEAERYSGGVAYIMVLNSMILRVPKFLKHLYSPILITLEKLISPLFFKWNSCFSINRWMVKK